MLAMRIEAIPGAPERGPSLDLEPCVRVDASVVQNLVNLELELGDARARRPDFPISVAVRCLDGAQLIRVEPWASQADDGLRTIELPDADDAAAALEARSRELALAIAELIRRLEITRPLPPEPPPPPAPPAPSSSAIPLVVTPSSPPQGPHDRWQIGALSTFEAFTGGQWLAGGDLSLGASIGRWVSVDLRAGGRFVEGLTSSSERLSGRAGVASLAAGLNVWSGRRVGFAIMLRGQGFGVEYRVGAAGADAARTARLGALVAAVEPRLLFEISRHIVLALGGAVGLPVRGVVVRVQGVETSTMSGLFLSGSLGVVVAL